MISKFNKEVHDEMIRQKNKMITGERIGVNSRRTFLEISFLEMQKKEK